jgi:hypothetical protein
MARSGGSRTLRAVSIWRPAAQRLADLPLVAERIENLTHAPAVLIRDLRCRCGASRNGPSKHGVGIIDYEQSSTGRAANRLRAEARSVRATRGDPEHGVSDRQLRNDVIAVAHPVKDLGAKGRLTNVTAASARSIHSSG